MKKEAVFSGHVDTVNIYNGGSDCKPGLYFPEGFGHKRILGIEDVARLAYAELQAYCHMKGYMSIEPWENAHADMKGMAVNSIRRQMRHGGKMSMESNHAQWFRDAVCHGWRWGDRYDPVRKTNPRLVPEFGDMPKEGRFICEIMVETFGRYRGELLG